MQGISWETSLPTGNQSYDIKKLQVIWIKPLLGKRPNSSLSERSSCRVECLVEAHSYSWNTTASIPTLRLDWPDRLSYRERQSYALQFENIYYYT